MITVDSALFDLRADPAAIESAVSNWTQVGPSGARAAGELRGASDANWHGSTCDSYRDFQGKLGDTLGRFGGFGNAMAELLTTAAETLRSGQQRLDAIKSEIEAVAPGTGNGGSLGFQPTDAEATALTHDRIAEAKRLRSELESTLAGLDFAAPQRDWAAISQQWQSITSGKQPAFPVPGSGTKSTETMVLPDGTVLVNTGTGHDKVRVTRDQSGDTLVTVNGHRLTVPERAGLVIRGDRGNDLVEADDRTPGLTFLGGVGNDGFRGGDGDDLVIGGTGEDELYGGGGDDDMSGGAGRDYLDGQAGNDRLRGDAGNDVVYGLRGNDRIDGGVGDDYLEGGQDNDSIDGGAGKDALSGGIGKDHLYGGAGHDTLYAGDGTDHLVGGDGIDDAHYQRGTDTVSTEKGYNVKIADHSFVRFGGDEVLDNQTQEFKDRMAADIGMLAGSKTGATMLNDLSAHVNDQSASRGPRYLHLEEFDEDGGTTSTHWWNPFDNDVYVETNPEFDGFDQPPSTVLYHELGHVYDHYHDSAAPNNHIDPKNPDFIEQRIFGPDSPKITLPTPNQERVVSGLPINADGDLNMTLEYDPDHPYVFTENALHKEMHIPDRKIYGKPHP